MNESSLTSVPRLLNDTLEPLDRLRSEFMDTLNKLSRRAADEIKRNALVLFDRHIPPEENLSATKRKNTGISIVNCAMCSVIFHFVPKTLKKL